MRFIGRCLRKLGLVKIMNGCNKLEVVNVPGPQGISVFTVTAADFVVPSIGDGVIVQFQNNEQFVSGSTVIVGFDATSPIGVFRVAQVGLGGLTTLIYVSGVNAGVTVPAGTKVVVSGISGQSAFAITTGSFTILAPGTGTTLNLSNNTWMAVGQAIIISDNAGNFATFEVNVIVTGSSSQVSVKWLGYSTDTWVQGNSIPIGSFIVCAGRSSSVSGLPSPITNNSYGNTSTTALPIGMAMMLLPIPLTSLATGLSTAAVTLLNAYTPGFRFYIESYLWVTTIVGAGASASQSFSLAITGAPLTGGVLTLTLASTNAIGSRTTSTSITGGNTGGPTDTLSINMASGGTAFTSGAGYFLIKIVNLDTANSIASINQSISTLIAAL